MSDPMTSTRYSCPYCNLDVVGGLSGHICDETEWMQHSEYLTKCIAKLETELKWLQNNHLRICLSENKLKAERDSLVEAIQAHKDSFIGKEEDIVPEDEALWKALLPKEKA